MSTETATLPKALSASGLGAPSHPHSLSDFSRKLLIIIHRNQILWNGCLSWIQHLHSCFQNKHTKCSIGSIKHLLSQLSSAEESAVICILCRLRNGSCRGLVCHAVICSSEQPLLEYRGKSHSLILLVSGAWDKHTSQGNRVEQFPSEKLSPLA